MFPTLTKRQKQILDFINVFSELHGYAPSLEDIKEHFQLSAISTVHEHIQNLKNKGYLHSEINQARSIRLVQPELKGKEFLEVPMLGRVVDNGKIELIKSNHTVLVHKDLTSDIGRHYALEFTTTEANKSGLCEGDILIVCEQDKSNPQALVVVQLHQRAQFLKQLKVQGKATELLSVNLNQTSIPMRAEDKIVGCITGLVRKYKH